MSLKNSFSQWLKLNKKISESSIKKYVGAVRTIGRFLSEELDQEVKIFNISTELEFNEIMLLINENNPKTFNRYNTGNNMYSIGMRYYGEFLEFYALEHKNGINNLTEVLEYEIEYIEGVRGLVTVNRYERDLNARKSCLEYHGFRCKICGFDPKKIYGKQFEGKIHVHHIIPLNEIGIEYKVDPIRDLIPVCPNCHMILHSRKPAFTPSEVKIFIQSNK